MNDPLTDPLKDPDNKQTAANRRSRYPLRKYRIGDIDDDLTSGLELIRKVRAKPKLRYVGPFKCDYCEREFDHKSSLAVHVKTCKVREIFEQENAFYDQRGQISNKIRIDRKCEPPMYRCSICQYSNTDRMIVKDHIINNHISTLPYNCTICNTCFRLKTSLTQHMKYKHTDVPPTICKICGRVFKRSVGLWTHIRNTHRKSDFKCKKCKRNMFSQINLDQHMLWHEKMDQVACHLCGMTFKWKRQLAGHMNIHEDFKPFSCPFCGKSFRWRNAQEQHTLTHTTLRPYVCSVCGLSFTQKATLHGHRKIHPGRLPRITSLPVGKLIMDYIQELQAASTELQESQEETDDLDLIQPKVEVLE